MGGVILLDTNALIYWGQGRLPEPEEGSFLITSVICELEVLTWPQMTPADEEVAREILKAVSVLPIDEPVKQQAIHIRRSTGLSLPDSIIAATASVTGAPLWTYDTALDRVEGLRVVAPPLLPV